MLSILFIVPIAFWKNALGGFVFDVRFPTRFVDLSCILLVCCLEGGAFFPSLLMLSAAGNQVNAFLFKKII